MNMHIEEEAANWYKEEFDLKEGDSLRFFPRLGGCSDVQKGFSLGVGIEKPSDIGVKETKNDILFFLEQKDLWYLDDHDFQIQFDSDIHEPVFIFNK
ncbi:HesB/YadR/YfhF family protein [Bacillus carboniphilus]|uniref:HesB/YadR/YfhF family protein n=1 Tax=Bacillus carboniphilus TaxID=86663 RepID=A0ABY9JXB9_9BACI|nr:HesB/YadR/YfhF family protein [Bacillus carboniphilus]WLR43433.1 HesB/YadR/YfhF family protein [Bacillus carboniphilus]